MNWQRSGR